MVRNLEISNSPDMLGETPFTGEAPCTGEVDMTLFPAEVKAIEALMMAYRQFLDLVQDVQPYPQQMTADFGEGIQWMQLSVGTVRFYHALHQEYRSRGVLKQRTPDSEAGLTRLSAPEKIDRLKDWKQAFQERTLFRHYPPATECVVDLLLAALEQMLQLTRAFPDQHAHGSFIRGLGQCENILNRLYLEQLIHQP